MSDGSDLAASGNERGSCSSLTLHDNRPFRGRDAIVSSAVNGSSYNGVNYTANVTYVTGLLPVGSEGISEYLLLEQKLLTQITADTPIHNQIMTSLSMVELPCCRSLHPNRGICRLLMPINAMSDCRLM